VVSSPLTLDPLHHHAMRRRGYTFQEVPLVVAFLYGLCAWLDEPVAMLVNFLFRGNLGPGCLRFIVSGRARDSQAISLVPGVQGGDLIM
jgi:hypothetical protein